MEGTQVQPGEAKGALAAGLKTVEEKLCRGTNRREQHQ
jgi:hypothetical protein